ncbi:bifunctional phosphopantothenoylcysteine decarboxylase/phosphopantothenate--cysteine ligase CoaBC [Aedoeadaptatus acetigenes]|uniref:bifunctional phosphopantothenoylcysteine decarboxylase/phosphopantothenate--cysteine ligase CoaBC n=1 Tax=Aedoeadaptatus acetigenes TaxID=2981723 RepID=UPI0011DD3110|nr:bifunctional phosphopantothenoylcysteine decarboxylase/phosphopantothenate--cysteine ligase CoaBC [Aedoeadaptatus acetigenes]MCU6787324.1 bifunctional phosphopantothenoylcysteine decarboxylase/phosphopantothenate--cysteine ligase CoaBC [Aedoeadaptatus acetigenes]
MKNKHVLLGVTGGIAAYKAPAIVSRLKKLGMEVKVVMTEAATKFVTPLTFQTMSNEVVHVDMFDQLNNMDVEHIALAKWADVMVIAPATANTMAKLAYGIADNMLTTVALATTAPILIAPAMNTQMLRADATQEALKVLKNRKQYEILPTAEGLLACQDVGEGKMLEPEDIVDYILMALTEKTMAGVDLTVTAGPTKERMDPVRFLSNHSTGKMGYAIAQEAAARGAKVHLISGPSNLKVPKGVDFVPVESTEDMFKAVEAKFDDTDVLIKSAAPSDYKPKTYAAEKIKKREGGLMAVEFSPNPDIAKHFGAMKGDRVIVGFAAESHNMADYAKKKLKEKNFNFIVANNITEAKAGFGSDTNHVHIFSADGTDEELPMMDKSDLAAAILDRVERDLKS